MEIIAFFVLFVGGYLAWKILVAALKGLFRVGQEISDSWPKFFEKVWQSVITGVVAGVIIGIFTGGNVELSSASAVGAAIVKVGYDVFSA